MTNVAGRVRQRAYEALLDLHTRKGARQEAIDTAEAYRKAFASNADVDRRTVFVESDLYWAWTAASNAAAPVAVLQGYVKRRPKDLEGCAQACLAMARHQLRAGLYDEARASARAALATDPANAGLGADALWMLQDIAARARQPEDRLQALEQSFADPYRDALSANDLARRRDLYAATLRDLGRYDALRRFLGDLAQADTSVSRRQEWCHAAAESYFEQSRFAEALAGYERVFCDHPAVSARWADAQGRIVESLLKLGRNEEALKAARVMYEAAPSPGSIDRSVQAVVAILKLIDGPKGTRADAFVQMHRYGPSGRDGKPGTADDPVPVLSKIAYPDLSARRRAFEAAMPAMGDGVDASLQRGWCCLYAADPHSALVHFADALRRSPVPRVGEVARTVMFSGFRPLRGSSAGLEDIGHFVAFGGAGPDGQVGTDDDLADPFAAAGVAGGPVQPGGVVALGAEERRALEALASELRELIERSETPSRQIAAANAYQRICEALVTVDRAETLAWVRATLAGARDERVQGALVRLGQSVAKAGQLDLGAVRAFWADLAADYTKAQRAMPGDVAGTRGQFEHMLGSLQKRVVVKR